MESCQGAKATARPGGELLTMASRNGQPSRQASGCVHARSVRLIWPRDDLLRYDTSEISMNVLGDECLQVGGALEVKC